ncbi:MAG: SPOR domain-containing protein [Methylococcaceae bacterium]|jgi:cell division protein FtsN
MARDYKYRAQKDQKSRRSSRSEGVGIFKWMLITALIIAFAVFLVYLRSTGSQLTETALVSPPVVPDKKPVPSPPVDHKEEKKPEPAAPVHQPPQLDFYTILPSKEVVVPDYEIKTRTREELAGLPQTKETKYIMQVGSFRSFEEADALRAKLALLGIESKIEKAKVGSVVWHRVKIGPYTQISSVSSTKARLRQQGIDALVTEVSNKP